jgi:type I restriction enzyme S subunit
MEIKIPPLAEQKAIAEALSSFDDKIENNNKQNELLEKTAQALYKEWFVEFNFPNSEGKPYKASGGEMIYNEQLKKDIPKDLSVKKIKDIVKINIRGISPKYAEDGVKVLNQRCIRNGIVQEEAIKYHNIKLRKFDKKYYLQPNDILINSMGVGTLGRISQVTKVYGEYLIHNCITIIRANKQIIKPLILGYNIKSMQLLFENMAQGSTGQTSLKNKQLDEIYMLVPNMRVQNNVNNLLKSCNYQKDLNQKENETLKQMRDTLLPKLMSGEVRVKGFGDNN